MDSRRDRSDDADDAGDGYEGISVGDGDGGGDGGSGLGDSTLSGDSSPLRSDDVGEDAICFRVATMEDNRSSLPIESGIKTRQSVLLDDAIGNAGKTNPSVARRTEVDKVGVGGDVDKLVDRPNQVQRSN
jgi:hypothetical protein